MTFSDVLCLIPSIYNVVQRLLYRGKTDFQQNYRLVHVSHFGTITEEINLSFCIVVIITFQYLLRTAIYPSLSLCCLWRHWPQRLNHSPLVLVHGLISTVLFSAGSNHTHQGDDWMSGGHEFHSGAATGNVRRPTVSAQPPPSWICTILNF